MTVRTVCAREPAHNLVATVQGRGPGKRLLLNGRLDTFCLALAFMLMAKQREHWDGELVLTLVGNEESGGWFGTGHPLETEACMLADAAIIADIGISRVLRFGGKGRARSPCSSDGKRCGYSDPGYP